MGVQPTLPQATWEVWAALNHELQHMALIFPNPSRSYDEAMHGIFFWGYDRTFEVAFFIENGALLKINAQTETDETGFLDTFDRNLNQIHKMANDLYSRRRKSSYIFSFTLSESNL